MARPNLLKPGERQVFHTNSIDWQPYLSDDGKPVPNMKWAPLSPDSDLRRAGRYLLRLEAGCVGPLHKHAGWDEFFVIDGKIIDSDGTVIGPGDYAIYKPGSVHWTDSPDGVTLLVTKIEQSIWLKE